MTQPWRVLFGVLVLAPLWAMAATPAASPSGIEGIILFSPSRPGPTRMDQPSTAPAVNAAFVVMKEGARIASFTTDAEGRFRVALPPGHYTVEKDPATKIGRWHFETDVKPGEMATVRWVGDSGMR